MLSKKTKETIIKKHAQSEGDTGSPEVQIAILSQEMKALSDHLSVHKKDNHSKVGLLRMVAKRRSLLGYLQKKSLERYQKLIKMLGLKK